jgi:hypothetical protein
MAGLGIARRIWLSRFSRPAAERILYRHVLRSRPRRLLELGLGLLARTERLLRASGNDLQYVGLDRFESRTPADPPGVSLKQAHRRLHGLARVQLVPGNVDTSLARLCNHLGVFDLVVVSADTDERHLERCWFFLQRLTSPGSTLFLESRTGPSARWSVVPKPRIDELAARSAQPPLRRAG